MSIEGTIQIGIGTINSGRNTVAINSSRPVHASQVMRGKTLGEAAQLLPMLFSVCGTAQACANARASESALGLPAQPATEILRDALVSAESLREHLWRVFLDWPSFVGEQADAVTMPRIGAWYRNLSAAFRDPGNPFKPGYSGEAPRKSVLRPMLDELEEVLNAQVFGTTSKSFQAISTLEDLIDWSERADTLPARLIRHIHRQGWSSAGRCEVAPLSNLEEGALHYNMENKHFVVAPTWDGAPRESSALTRQQHPLLERLRQAYGNGLLTRITARLIETVRLPATLANVIATPTTDNPIQPIRLSSNPALGITEAARGRLIHRLGLNGERIVLYQILAPTEWNFHPEGVVAQALATLAGTPEEIRQQAHLIINTIDPCVQYHLKVD